jgi:hypothetical protein
MASRSRWCAWILSLVAMDSWLMSRLLRSLHLRIGEAAPDQPAKASSSWRRPFSARLGLLPQVAKTTLHDKIRKYGLLAP